MLAKKLLIGDNKDWVMKMLNFGQQQRELAAKKMQKTDPMENWTKLFRAYKAVHTVDLSNLNAKFVSSKL